MSAVDSGPLRVMAHYRAVPRSANTVARLLDDVAAQTRAEPGNRSYDVFRSIADPSRFLILEEYEDEAAFALHRESEHFRAIVRARIVPLLEERKVLKVTVTESGGPC